MSLLIRLGIGYQTNLIGVVNQHKKSTCLIKLSKNNVNNFSLVQNLKKKFVC